MKVCPQCGFTESPLWRHRRAWSGLNEEVCNLDDLEKLEPWIHMLLKVGVPKYRDSNYVYRIVKTRKASRFGGGLVVRTYIPEAEAAGTRKRIHTERPTWTGGYTEA